ncbi:monooxygenase family protein, partial [Salmonella enterica]|uniref:monooxygenase family protein n=1 Tax=Salmonella enterica TaxID=28901 RepID=UPI003299BE6C
NKDLKHRPAQREFFRRTAYNGHVGVWHETYRVRAGEFEAIYANMPRMGLAAAGEYRSLRKNSTMRDRVGKTDAH